MNDELLVIFGGEVKSLGGGKVGGQLVTFGSPKSTDLEGDFFDAETDFDVDFSEAVKSTVYYNHGTDPNLGRKKLGGGIKATLSRNDVGIWIEAQLDERDEYERAILGLVDQKKLGWSSGTAGYLVEREPIGKSFHIKKWTLGVDASLTPTPAEHRNSAVALKSLDLPSFKSLVAKMADPLLEDDTEASKLGTDVYESLTISALCQLWQMFMSYGLWQAVYNDFIAPEERLSQIDAGLDQLAAKGKAVARAILALDVDELSEEYQMAKSLFFDAPDAKRFDSLRKQIEFTMETVKTLDKRVGLILSNKTGTKVGAPFNAKNREYLLSVADSLVTHGNGMKDLITPMQAPEIMDMGKSIQACELRLAELTVNHLEAIQ